MKETPNPDPSGAKPQTAPLEQDPLGRLEDLLEKHLKLVADGDFQSVLNDGPEVDNLLRLASESGPGSAEQLKRVIKLHRRLHLLTTTEKEQMQSTLAKVRRGKQALRKYQGHQARSG